MTTPWYDSEMRGRRLEAICKRMNTQFWNNIDDNPELAMSYLERLLKVEHSIMPFIEHMTGVKKLMKQQGVKYEKYLST